MTEFVGKMLHHRGMEATDASVLPKGMECRDVAISDDRFAGSADEFDGNHVENLHTAVAATRTPDDVHVLVLECVEEVLGTFLRSAGETTVAAFCVGSYRNLVAP